jgi:hypothetical protein
VSQKLKTTLNFEYVTIDLDDDVNLGDTLKLEVTGVITSLTRSRKSSMIPLKSDRESQSIKLGDWNDSDSLRVDVRAIIKEGNQ